MTKLQHNVLCVAQKIFAWAKGSEDTVGLYPSIAHRIATGDP